MARGSLSHEPRDVPVDTTDRGDCPFCGCLVSADGRLFARAIYCDNWHCYAHAGCLEAETGDAYVLVPEAVYEGPEPSEAERCQSGDE